jgi:hypothetical protein
MGLGMASLSHAQEQPTIKIDIPHSYTVVKGDTLWDISARFLEDPWLWKEIWQGNSQIANPDLIYPGDIIRLIYVDGKPQLVVNSDAASTRSYPSNNGPLKTVKLSPKIHSEKIKTAIPAIPLETINTFLLRNRVVEKGVLKEASHVLGGQEKRVILSAGDTLYARGEFPENTRSYGLYRKGQSYIDPKTKEVLGVQAIDIGAVNLRSSQDDIGSFTVTRSTNEIRVGDRLLPNEEREINANFLPVPPKNEVSGYIMNVETGLSQAGKLDIIAINLGKREQLEQGHILAIYKQGPTIRDRHAQPNTKRNITLPNERAGLILVFQVFEKMSLAIVLEADRGVVLRDLVGNP